MDILKYKGVFFDLDGTLIDSARDLHFAVVTMAQNLNLKQPELTNVKNWIGNGTLKLVERTLYFATHEKPSSKDLEQAFFLFSEAYRDCVGEYSILFPNTQALLVKLLANNIKLACITNKPLEFTKFLLQQNMVSQFFSVLCTGDNVKHKKPNAWPLLHASKSIHVNINDCLMIGDSQHDIMAARNAGCDVIAVSYGYNHGENISNYNPDGIIDDFKDLI